MTTELQARAERPSPSARVRYNASLKKVRRVHMYAGIFLVPFVLLYGATAFLFNHPDWFSDRSVRAITSQDTAGTPLATFPAADALAARLIAGWNQSESSPSLRASPVVEPFYSRDLALTATGAGTDRVIFLDLEGRVGTVRSAPAPEPVTLPPWVQKRIKPGNGPAPAEQARASVADVLSRWGASAEEVRVRTPADLIFAVEDEKGVWRVAYNLQTEAISVRPWGPELTARRYLTAMHLACRYPSQVNIKWLWALLVDAMALAMVFWSLSGLAMWWQMKSLRRFGAVVVVASLIASTAIALGMHGVISR